MWAFKSSLEIPLAHISEIRADPAIAHGWWHGLRMPGTKIPGVLTAGTFYQDGKRVFWDVHNPENTVVLRVDSAACRQYRERFFPSPETLAF
jgi:hypothetical protein